MIELLSPMQLPQINMRTQLARVPFYLVFFAAIALGAYTTAFIALFCILAMHFAWQVARWSRTTCLTIERFNLMAVAVNGTSNIVVITDKKRCVTWVNEGFTRKTGLAIEDVFGKPPGDVLRFHETDPAATVAIKDALNNVQPFSGEIQCLSKSGDVRWLDLVIDPIVDRKGQVCGFISIETDVTKRKLAEICLANEQSKFRSIFDGASDAIMLLDKSGFLDCNPRTLTLFGIQDREHFAKLHPNDLSPEFQEDGTPSSEKSEWHIGIAMLIGENRFEWLHQRADGMVFPAEVLLCAFQLDGRTVLQATVRDISVRKQNEMQLKQLNERLNVDLEARRKAEASLRNATAYLDVYRHIVDQHAIVAETDVKGSIVRVNDLFCEISGYTREELVGQNHRILNSGVHPQSLWREMYRTVAHGGIWRGEICNRSKFGNLYWVDTTIAPLFDEMHNLRGYFSLRTDITSLKNAQKQAESSSLAKSEFLANMSHEIRTPMTAILGFADLLAEECGPSQAPNLAEYIETIKRNGEHLLSIINDILDISKIEAEKMVVEMIEMDPMKIVEEMVSTMRVRADAKGLSLRTELLSAIPKKIVSDPTRVRQILDNLVGNAIKFTERGGILVQLGIDSNDPQLIQFTVVDTGIGIKDEQLKRLFGSFEQADASTTRRYGGSGLGLSISKKLSQMLGGDLAVTTEIGKGSTFTASVKTHVGEYVEMADFIQGTTPWSNETLTGYPAEYFPGKYSDPENSSSEAFNGPPFSGIAPPRRLAGIRILLVEDGLDNQRLIAHHLEKAGAIVQFAENGKVAVQRMTIDGTIEGDLASPSPFDLILSDIQMPEMDGFTSTKLLREKGCIIPIVALTAHAMSSDARKCIEAGCNFHLSKPIDQKLLISTCENWINMQNEINLSSMNKIVSEFANDPDMEELLTEYIASFGGTVTAIKKKFEDRSFVDLGRIAHQLKGSGGGYGFPLISEAASKLEAKVKATTRSPDSSEETLSSIQNLVTELISILEIVRGSNPLPNAVEKV